ncbi:dihydroneopterin aldolase [Pseudalkalibacillus berkeleyi]|uniref:7,8-dihydroneopterin aldolase n=1 Tax=Pseudalkalibacillus berkeleyi TaxID=1069813 RepID=A0ABS9H6Z7_9BACL|nr:dihydroneopterin aldolase [Pseudalkalibacillus berkeleyi]MCF6139653.1 dihydroneopterin aldolase [Pseudalkalibacillus berkeleyi]
MDKIYIDNMKFYGYHGVYPEENKLGQRFNVNLVLECDLANAAKTDDIESTVHYGQAYEITKEIVEGEPKKLVESIAEDIAQALLGEFPIIQACTVKVIKPDPPIPGHYDAVAIEMKRSRS